MKQWVASLAVIALFFTAELFSAKRDYQGSSQDFSTPPDSIFYPTSPSHPHPNYIRLNYMFCIGCVTNTLTEKGKVVGIEKHLLRHIPSEGPTCYSTKCPYKWPTFYQLYLSRKNGRYLSHIVDHLEYCDKHDKCRCYWPEYSAKAAHINDEAYDLFRALITNTILGTDLHEDYNCEHSILFRTSGFTFRSIRSITLSIIAYQFRFSHFYHVYRDILKWSQAFYTDTEVAEIKDRLETILDSLYPKFLELHSECLKQHWNPVIEDEIKLIKFLTRHIFSPTNYSIFGESGVVTKGELPKKHKKDKKKKKKKQPAGKILIQSKTTHFDAPIKTGYEGKYSSHSLEEALLFEEGATYNDVFLFENAIDMITKSLKIDPLNSDAYFERAIAFFETGQFDSALIDYQEIKKIRTSQVVEKGIGELYLQYLDLQSNSVEFAKGLLVGSLEGAGASAADFFPSVVHSARGLAHGLWRFVASPEEMSREFLLAAYDMGVYISSLDSNQCLELVIPEMRELSQNWKLMDAPEKGKKIGYIIGKYGIDIFITCASSIRGIQKLQSLKKANVSLTLEMCTASQAKKAVILEESTKYSQVRNAIVQSTKRGKIVPKNANVQPHVMQRKHAWDKLVLTSGNAEEDFKKVITLLEEHSIMDKSCIKGAPQSFPQGKPKIIRSSHKKMIHNCEVEAVFETYIETGEMYLQNAWVVAR